MLHVLAWLMFDIFYHSVPPFVSEIDRNRLIQLSGIVSTLREAVAPTANQGVTDAFNALLSEIGTLFLQTSNFFFIF